MNSLGAEEAPSPARAPPKGLAARLSMGSQERRKLNEKRRQSSSDNLKALGQQQAGEPGSGSGSSTPQKEGTRAPGSSGSDRGYLDMPGSRASSASSNTSTLKHTRASSPPVIAPAFVWGTRDDEMLRLTSSWLMTTPAGPNCGLVSSGKHHQWCCWNGIHVGVKGRGRKDRVHHGDYQVLRTLRGHRGQHFEGDMARGSQCLVGGDMVGYCVNMKTVPTRPRGELIEIDLHPDRKDKSDKEVEPRPQAGRKCGNTQAIDESCSAKPSQDLQEPRGPYFGPPTLRPQVVSILGGPAEDGPTIRSKGIGYLRLGDDMSNYGSAFLSLDAGATYLDDGESGAVASNASTLRMGPVEAAKLLTRQFRQL